MTDVLKFLERVGSESRFHGQGSEDLLAAVAESEMEESIKAAFVKGDPAQVRALLGQRPLIAMIMPAEEEEGEEGEEEKEEEPDPASRPPGSRLFCMTSTAAEPSRR